MFNSYLSRATFLPCINWNKYLFELETWANIVQSLCCIVYLSYADTVFQSLCTNTTCSDGIAGEFYTADCVVYDFYSGLFSELLDTFIPTVHIGCEVILGLIQIQMLSLEDGGQSPQFPSCEKIYSNVYLRLKWTLVWVGGCSECSVCWSKEGNLHWKNFSVHPMYKAPLLHLSLSTHLPVTFQVLLSNKGSKIT